MFLFSNKALPNGLLILLIHLLLSSAGVARVLCSAEKTASPRADDLQLHLLRMGEPMVLPADAVQHERGLHERPPNGILINTCNSKRVVYII